MMDIIGSRILCIKVPLLIFIYSCLITNSTTSSIFFQLLVKPLLIDLSPKSTKIISSSTSSIACKKSSNFLTSNKSLFEDQSWKKNLNFPKQFIWGCRLLHLLLNLLQNWSLSNSIRTFIIKFTSQLSFKFTPSLWIISMQIFHLLFNFINTCQFKTKNILRLKESMYFYLTYIYL